VLASLRFDHNRVIVAAGHKASEQHPSAVKRGGIGATICLSTQAVKMGLELLGELLALRRQIGKQRLQCRSVDVLRRRAEPAFAVLADFDEVMEHLAFCSFSHRILQLFREGVPIVICADCGPTTQSLERSKT
jgi:hypothetical protein